MLLVFTLLTLSVSAPADVLIGILKTRFGDDMPSGAFSSWAHWFLASGPAAGKPSWTPKAQPGRAL